MKERITNFTNDAVTKRRAYITKDNEQEAELKVAKGGECTIFRNDVAADPIGGYVVKRRRCHKRL